MSSVVVSGMRPTGRLHLGHYYGTLLNWLFLQESHSCYFFIADLHALTTEFENPSAIATHTLDVVKDWLACGIDPKKSTIFVQSQIPEHLKLYFLLSMITPVSWLERTPSYREMKETITDKDLNNLGFLGYPALQAADILLYQTDLVPVGLDQAPHVELTREIARRFNTLYGPTFKEPQALLTPISKLLGIDGKRKMGKSYHNTIDLADTPDVITEKVKNMVTDPQRQRRSDPGNPDVCNVYSFHKLVSSSDEVQMVDRECRSAGIGCFDCKKLMGQNLIKKMGPITEKRRALDQNPGDVVDIIQTGTKKAQAIATAQYAIATDKLNFKMA